MKILTYNLWHGLTPSSAVSMEYLEPEARRRQRLLMQLKLIKSLEFDLGLFQEVNPLFERASELEAETEKSTTYQSDLVGIKILGMGLPNFLNSGLLTLAEGKYHLRRVRGVKLSGPGRSFVSPWLSFQLKEERYALLSEFLHPQWGRGLVVNTHLHHGLELTDPLTEEIRTASKEFGLSSTVENEIFDRLLKGNERRLKEMKRLIDEVMKIQDRYNVILIGGDFNARPESEVGQLLKEYDFKDSFTMQSEVSEAYTYDRERNSANHKLQARFPLTVRFEDLSFSKKITLGLREILTRHEHSQRRIDQVWVKSSFRFKSKVELIGLEEEAGFAPSDHFGYLVSLEEF